MVLLTVFCACDDRSSTATGNSGDVAPSTSRASAHATRPVLLFGIVPQSDSVALMRSWQPALAYISERAQVTLEFATAPSIPEFERRLSQGEYDLAYMNSYHYTVFHQDPGYVAFAREKDKGVTGIVVVRKDSAITGMSELNGRALAFPSRAAFIASILPRTYIAREGWTIKPVYVSSHDAVYRAVAKGLYPAGGGAKRTLQMQAPEVQSELRVLWTSESYTPHAFAAHPRVAAEHVSSVRDAMMAMHESAAGRALLDALAMGRFASASDSDWDDVRGLGIDLLQDFIRADAN